MVNYRSRGLRCGYRSGPFFFLLVMVITACGPITPTTPTSVAVSPGDPAYPPQERDLTGYPNPATLLLVPEEAYPAPIQMGQDGIAFAFNTPIEAGATSVSGVGPPGLMAKVVNITFMGEEIGSGVIENDGTFLILVTPLEAGVRIGITGDIESHGLEEENIVPGPGAMTVPQVGHFYDSYVILQP
jgi:hypothetical protein